MLEYTIKALANLAGISARTLRYYDEIELLKPSRITESGYRMYGQKEVDYLQQILFYRAMDMKLEDIRQILSQSDDDRLQSLLYHHQQLLNKRDQLDTLIKTMEKTIAYKKGERKMSDKEKFEVFKQKKLAENEKEYGKEIREKYGEKKVEEANKKFRGLSEADFKKMNETELEMFIALKDVVQTKDIDTDKAREVFEKHKAWLLFSWPTYSSEAHKGLAEMYVADERFARYYNEKVGEEVVEILRDIIVKYAK